MQKQGSFYYFDYLSRTGSPSGYWSCPLAHFIGFRHQREILLAGNRVNRATGRK